MTPQHVISQLLESDSKYPNNIELLKKIILVTYLGRLSINGLPADNQISLGNYLFDNEHTLFDLTRLSPGKRTLFKEWLLALHQQEKSCDYPAHVSTNEYRGFTAEVELSLWGTINNWVKKTNSEHWKITDLSLSLNYQLTGIELCHGQDAILVGFNQFLVPATGTKYKGAYDDQPEPMGNTKRVLITDSLVDLLHASVIKQFNFEALCKSPHPQAVEVIELDKRHQEMHTYRNIQKFIALKPWYRQLWNWLRSIFIEQGQILPYQFKNNPLTILYKNNTTTVYQRDSSKELIVTEARPDIKNLVFCGGGSKIFAHIGVWKALSEANIKPVKFAGSSAGAIMALLCYLGYEADEISELFTHFKQQHLVYFDIDRNGLSDPHALKTALDYAIARKLDTITQSLNIQYPTGKITFARLNELKNAYPQCGIGDELIVTATNKRLRKTTYFSLEQSPYMELSEAVKISSSVPLLYRNTVIDGDEHNDGGVLNNFPTEVFSDDHSTLLESEYGNNLQLLAVQFDNGTERDTVDRVMDRVYKENFIINWFYSLITGVKDPASGWEQDRMKLRKYAAQSIIVTIDSRSSASFSVDSGMQLTLIDSGYDATQEYLKARYTLCDGAYKNVEMMYSTFNSLGDLLAYCCYRGDLSWFNIVHNLIAESSQPNKAHLIKHAVELRQLYFKPNNMIEAEPALLRVVGVGFFARSSVDHFALEHDAANPQILLALYPIFLKLNEQLTVSNDDKKLLALAHHAFDMNEPFRCLHFFEQMKGEMHIVLYAIIKMIKELHHKPRELIFSVLKQAQEILYSSCNIAAPVYYDRWDLTIQQCMRSLKLINNNEQQPQVQRLLGFLSQRAEPLQTISDGIFVEDDEDVEYCFKP